MDNLLEYFEMIKSSFNNGPDRRCTGKNHSRVHSFTHDDGTKLVVLYGPKSPINPVCSIAVHDPTEAAMQLIAHALHWSGLSRFTAIPRMVEIALDIQCNFHHSYLFFEHIANHLFLPHQRQAAGSYRGLTYYSTNVRRAAKGHRVYQKNIDGKWVIRLELVMNRPVLKRLRVNLTNAHTALSALDLTPFIQFKTINIDGLGNFIVKRRQPNKHRAIRQGLMLAQLQSYLTVNGQELMPQVEQLKKLGSGLNLSRFVVRDEAFEQAFFGHLT